MSSEGKDIVHWRLVKDVYYFENSLVGTWKLDDDRCIASHSRACFSFCFCWFSDPIYYKTIL